MIQGTVHKRISFTELLEQVLLMQRHWQMPVRADRILLLPVTTSRGMTLMGMSSGWCKYYCSVAELPWLTQIVLVADN